MDAIYVPPFDIMRKPKLGEACNGCGLCCAMEVCYLGREAFGLKKYETPCPAMVFSDNKVRCGLVVAEKSAELSPILHNALGIGRGCDADDSILESGEAQ